MGLWQIRAPLTVERTALFVFVGLLAALAWLVLWLSGSSLHGLVHLHHQAAGAAPPPALFALLFLAGWTVMTVAMMLPSSLPVLAAFHTLARGRPDRGLLLALVVVGYLATWAAFGAVVWAASLALRGMLAASPRAHDLLWLGAPALLLLVGSFQFTSLKDRCLEQCRSPLSFVLSHWQGARNRWQAFRLGVDHGVFCVGCCWALMLLMFLAATGYLAWMLLLGAIMAVEKNVSWGRRLSAPVGVVLIVSAAAVLLMPG